MFYVFFADGLEFGVGIGHRHGPIPDHMLLAYLCFWLSILGGVFYAIVRINLQNDINKTIILS